MTTSEWARTTITVFDGDGGIPETIDLPGESPEAHLVAAEVWLTDRGPNIRVDGGAMRLFCSWTPTEDKRAMTLPATLVHALAEADGVFWMDVYPLENTGSAPP